MPSHHHHSNTATHNTPRACDKISKQRPRKSDFIFSEKASESTTKHANHAKAKQKKSHTNKAKQQKHNNKSTHTHTTKNQPTNPRQLRHTIAQASVLTIGEHKNSKRIKCGAEGGVWGVKRRGPNKPEAARPNGTLGPFFRSLPPTSPRGLPPCRIPFVIFVIHRAEYAHFDGSACVGALLIFAHCSLSFSQDQASRGSREEECA